MHEDLIGFMILLLIIGIFQCKSIIKSAKEGNRIAYRFVIPSSIMCLMLLIAPLPLPYDYYKFLRVVILIGCICNIIALFKMFETQIFIPLFVIIGVLFNPIIPIHLSRGVWMYIDFTTVSLMLWLIHANCEGFTMEEFEADKQEAKRIEKEKSEKDYNSADKVYFSFMTRKTIIDLITHKTKIIEEKRGYIREIAESLALESFINEFEEMSVYLNKKDCEDVIDILLEEYHHQQMTIKPTLKDSNDKINQKNPSIGKQNITGLGV